MKKLSMKGKSMKAEDILMMIIVVLIVVIVIYWIYNSMKKSDRYEGFFCASNRNKACPADRDCHKTKGCVARGPKVQNQYGNAGKAAPVINGVQSVWSSTKNCFATGCVGDFGVGCKCV